MSLNYLKDKIKDTVPVSEVAEYYLGKPKISNRYHCHINPAENRDNLAIYKDHWHCFYCNEGGDTIALVQSIFGIDYAAAINKISQDFGIVDDTNVENMTPELRKRLFEADKARVVRSAEKRRDEEYEKNINRKIIMKIQEMNKIIDETNAIIRSEYTDDKDVDTALEKNIFAEKRLRELIIMSNIMSNKTFEGNEWYIYPETTETEKQLRKQELIKRILYRQVEI